jgi:hypothetical protein
MSQDGIAEQRRWFRFFPEGSIEFTIITRVLALILLLALAVVSGTQRVPVLLALSMVLWADYMLTLWWLIQMASDLNALAAASPPSAAELSRERLRIGAMVTLSATAAFLMLAPWPAVAPARPPLGFVARTLPIAMYVVYPITVVLAWRSLRTLALNRPGRTFLLLVPIVHWIALHRLMGDLEARLKHGADEKPHDTGSSSGDLSTMLIAADVVWVLGVLPWLVLYVLALAGGDLSRIGLVCATMLSGLFAVIDLAAMESLQRRFVGALRKR